MDEITTGRAAMFSDHLPKIEEMPYRTLLLVAAGLVILCQLAAMAFVAESQVAKAKERDDQRRAELMAISQCMETSAGAARSQCIQQARVVATASAARPPKTRPRLRLMPMPPRDPRAARCRPIRRRGRRRVYGCILRDSLAAIPAVRLA
jgi:hypothetical protein